MVRMDAVLMMYRMQLRGLNEEPQPAGCWQKGQTLAVEHGPLWVESVRQMTHMIEKIVSGGQTGVDRAGLDVAIALGIPHGGWCPKGRKAEDGALPAIYQLQETPTADYKQRTAWNVRDSDGTLIMTRGIPTGGTATTIKLASTHGKPCLVLDLLANPTQALALDWIANNRIRVLNVAGPRESGCPGIHAQATAFLQRCLHT